MVERMIGGRARGTGGAGVPYLAQTTAYRFFPELWEARNSLTADAGGYVYE
jgi:tryptophan 2,3-dioxygenase